MSRCDRACCPVQGGWARLPLSGRGEGAGAQASPAPARGGPEAPTSRSRRRGWLGHRQLHTPPGREAEGLEQKMPGSSAWVTGREGRFLGADAWPAAEVLTEETGLGPFQPVPEAGVGGRGQNGPGAGGATTVGGGESQAGGPAAGTLEQSRTRRCRLRSPRVRSPPRPLLGPQTRLPRAGKPDDT